MPKTFRMTIQDNEGNLQDVQHEFTEADLDNFAAVGDLVNALKTACMRCHRPDPPAQEPDDFGQRKDDDPIPF